MLECCGMVLCFGLVGWLVTLVIADGYEYIKKREFCQVRKKLMRIVLTDLEQTGENHGHIVMPEYSPYGKYGNGKSWLRFGQIADDGKQRQIYITADGQEIFKTSWWK